MQDEPIKYNGSMDIASRLRRLQFIRRFCHDIGHSATQAQLLAIGILKKEVHFSSQPAPFIQKLSNIVQKKPSADAAELAHVIEQSNEVLAKATTVFPLSLFPDTIILDRTKLTVIKRNFFFSEQVMSIRIEDILNVSATVGPFFGSVTIATRVMSSDDHFTIRNFTREDAQHLKHMIQGYVIARHNNIACDHLTHDQLVDTLRELGHDTNRLFQHRVIQAPQRLLEH